MTAVSRSRHNHSNDGLPRMIFARTAQVQLQRQPCDNHHLRRPMRLPLRPTGPVLVLHFHEVTTSTCAVRPTPCPTITTTMFPMVQPYLMDPTCQEDKHHHPLSRNNSNNNMHRIPTMAWQAVLTILERFSSSSSSKSLRTLQIQTWE